VARPPIGGGVQGIPSPRSQANTARAAATLPWPVAPIDCANAAPAGNVAKAGR